MKEIKKLKNVRRIQLKIQQQLRKIIIAVEEQQFFSH